MQFKSFDFSDYFVCTPDFKVAASAECDGNNDCSGIDEDPTICNLYHQLGFGTIFFN